MKQACSSVSSWATQYASTAVSIYTPTSTPTAVQFPTAQATAMSTGIPPISRSLNEYYVAARKERQGTGDIRIVAAVIYVPVGLFIFAITAITLFL